MSKTWFITGTSSGFGRTLTETLLARGDRVAATLRKVDALDDLKAHHGDRLWVAPLDVTDLQAVRRVVDRGSDDGRATLRWETARATTWEHTSARLLRHFQAQTAGRP